MAAPSNPSPSLPVGASPAIVGSIRQAARTANVDFGLLMAEAQQESGFDSAAKASGSSATGLFQFIDNTWFSLVQRVGARYGVGDLARHIAIDSAGRASVADPALRQRILDLRKDPSLSAALAAEYARQNKDALEQALGHSAGNADMYMAHFLGAGGAIAFLKALDENGAKPAAELLPAAAAANRSVFYDERNGRAKTVAEIYQSFASRIDAEAARLGQAKSDPLPGLSPSSAVPVVLRGLGISGQSLSPTMIAILDVFAFSALKLLGGNDVLPARGPGSPRAI
jgi:Transglycosylase SLT domain